MSSTEHPSASDRPKTKDTRERDTLDQGQCDSAIGHGLGCWHSISHRNAVDVTPHKQRLTKRLHHLVLLTLSVLFLFMLQWRFHTVRSPSHEELGRESKNTVDDPGLFNWTDHPPSKSLNWTKCYSDFQCARLAVPLLYSEPSGEEGAVAVIKSPSRYPRGHERYRGPIIFNPGGPGGSAVQFIRGYEQFFRTILTDEFDLIGFDPRGVGFTTPVFSVFESDLEAGKFNLQFPMNVNSSASALGEAYARTRILGKLVADRAKYLAERISTPTVARDMLSIIRAAGLEKLQYWGFSYGTTLGSTFAAMFPDNVGRIVIDGVTDSEDYYRGQWANHLWDADAALLDIFQACMVAGPSKCSIYENSTYLIQARVDSLLESLRSTPVLLYNDSSSSLGGEYDVIDYAFVKSAIFRTLYKTHKSGALLMDALVALERGDASKIYALSGGRGSRSLMSCNCADREGDTAPSGSRLETVLAIMCGDGKSTNVNLEELREAYSKLAETTSFADTWLALSYCSGWNLHTKDRFNGSFVQSTSHPLMLIGNVADPVTPLRNAHKMSKGFEGSVVLTQNSSGHGSVAATSLCTIKAVRDYFFNGTLPENGTVCEVQSSIFGEKGPGLDVETLSSEERELLDASRMLQEHYFISMLGGSS